MNPSSTTHFALYGTIVTIAFALSLPEIPWLRPISYAIIFACWVLFRGERHAAERLPWLGLVLFGAMGLVLLNVTAPHNDYPHSIRPSLSFAGTMVMIWALCVFRQYRWWNSQRLPEG